MTHEQEPRTIEVRSSDFPAGIDPQSQSDSGFRRTAGRASLVLGGVFLGWGGATGEPVTIGGGAALELLGTVLIGREEARLRRVEKALYSLRVRFEEPPQRP